MRDWRSDAEVEHDRRSRWLVLADALSIAALIALGFYAALSGLIEPIRGALGLR